MSPVHAQIRGRGGIGHPDSPAPEGQHTGAESACLHLLNVPAALLGTWVGNTFKTLLKSQVLPGFSLLLGTHAGEAVGVLEGPAETQGRIPSGCVCLGLAFS